jgi:hypothetical protein
MNPPNTFSCKAATRTEAVVLLAVLRGRFPEQEGVRVEHFIEIDCGPSPKEVHFQFQVPLPLEEVRRELEHIENSQSMLDTLLPCALSVNHLVYPTISFTEES